MKSATDAKLEEQVYQEMMTLAKSYSDVPVLRQTIDNPMLEKSKKQTLLETAVGGTPSKLMQTFIALVLKEDRENMVQFMAYSYVTLYRKQKNVIRGKLTTAARVSAETEQKMRQMVESKTQGILNTLKK